MSRHLPQRDVGKDNVRRHATLVREALAKLAELLEQRLVAGDLPGAVLRRLPRRGHWSSENNLLPRSQCRAAFVCQFSDVELLRILPQKSQPHQFTTDSGPFRTAMLAANIVRR